MAQVRNLSKEIITTITAGNVAPERSATIADWEAPIVKMLHGKYVEVTETPKKGRK